MAITQYKPTSPARRGMTTQNFEEITSKKPIRSLIKIKKGPVGRNNQGRITTRHRGGGARRYYRLINYSLPQGTLATIEEIEYDPNRSAHIARIKDHTGGYHYVLAAKGMKVGGKITVDEEASITVGNQLALKNIPAGTIIHSVELQPGRGAQIARTAGASAQIVAKDENYAQVRLPSGEIRLVNINCMAVIGSVGNEQHQNIKVGSAGRKRHMGFRPAVRGVVMNAVDHPHGGGDGGRHGTAKDPRTPWGQKTLGYKTRTRRKSNKFIIRSRHLGKRK